MIPADVPDKPVDVSETAPAAAGSGRAPPSGIGHRLVLASASPRRLALLRQVGLEPDAVVATAIDETPGSDELPRHYAARMAREKAAAAYAALGGETERTYLVAADTVVAVGRRILPKAETDAQARACLALLAGRRHRVYTAVALVPPHGRMRNRLVETRVRFKRLSAPEIDAYLASGEWRGKAGGYALQGLAGAFVQDLSGSPSAVIGLPLHEVVGLLEGEGFAVRQAWPR